MTPPADDIAGKESVPFVAAAGAAAPEEVLPGAPVAWITGRQLIVAVAIVLAALVPFVFKSFVTFQLTQVMVYALAILGLNILTGFNGQFSLGHSAFYGIGAYTAAILMHHWEVSYVLALPAAGAVCFVVGFLFGLPALRLQGLYLALATFALAIALPRITVSQSGSVSKSGWSGSDPIAVGYTSRSASCTLYARASSGNH